MKPAVESALTGGAKGAVNGALFGACAVGILAVGLAIVGVGPFAGAFVGGGFMGTIVSSAAIFLESIFYGSGTLFGMTGIGGAVLGGGVGAVYKGSQDCLDTLDVEKEKNRQTTLAHPKHTVKKAQLAPALHSHAQAVSATSTSRINYRQDWADREKAKAAQPVATLVR